MPNALPHCGFALLVSLCCVTAQAGPLDANDDLGRMLQDKGWVSAESSAPTPTLRTTGPRNTANVPNMLWVFAHPEAAADAPAPPRVRSSSLPANGRADDLVVYAMGYLDIPYQWGGTSPDTGFDCSGFVQAVYEQAVGLVLPRQADKQAQATEEIGLDELAPGDLVFFNTMSRPHSHVGIYIGKNRFIHSPSTGSRVRLEEMQLSYWKTRLDGLRRVSLGALSLLMD